MSKRTCPACGTTMSVVHSTHTLRREREGKPVAGGAQQSACCKMWIARNAPDVYRQIQKRPLQWDADRIRAKVIELKGQA